MSSERTNSSGTVRTSFWQRCGMVLVNVQSVYLVICWPAGKTREGSWHGSGKVMVRAKFSRVSVDCLVDF